MAATFLDAFDGAAARLLKASSKLGAELDSLSDFVAFGVAPALVIFLWSMHEMGRWGWFIALVYVMALALRLARFNVQKEEDEEACPNSPLLRYFTGVPSPVSAGLCLLPMIVSFLVVDYGLDVGGIFKMPVVVGGWTLYISALAVSHIPTFSTKQIRVPYRLRVIALGFFGLLIAGLINDPWPTLTLMGVIYLLMLPIGYLHYKRTERAVMQGETFPDPDDIEDS